MRQRARRVMTRDERAAIEGVVERLPAAVQRLERRARRARAARRHRGPPADPVAVVERRRPLVGRAARVPRGADGARRTRSVRLGLSRSGRAIRTCRNAAGAARSGRRTRRSGRVSARSRPTTGGRSPRTRRPSRATSTSGSTRSRAFYRGAGPRRGGAARAARGGRVHVDPVGRRAAVRAHVRRVPRRRSRRSANRHAHVGALVPRLDDGPASSSWVTRSGRAGPPDRPHPGTLGAALRISRWVSGAPQHGVVGTRERPVDIGAARGRALTARILGELRDGRLDRGLAGAEIARAVGLSAAQFSRIERGLSHGLTIQKASELLAVVGLELAVQAFPSGEPLRDQAHAALLDRFRLRLHASLRFRHRNAIP